jgi:hypothetical protein
MSKADRHEPYEGNCIKCLTLCTILCRRGREHAAIEVHICKGNAHLFVVHAYSPSDGSEAIWEDAIVQEWVAGAAWWTCAGRRTERIPSL